MLFQIYFNFFQLCSYNDKEKTKTNSTDLNILCLLCPYFAYFKQDCNQSNQYAKSQAIEMKTDLKTNKCKFCPEFVKRTCIDEHIVDEFR